MQVVYTCIKILGQSVHKLLIRQGLEFHCHYDLDLWPRHPIFNRVIYSSWPTTIPSLKIIDQCVFKLLIGQGFELQCDLDLWPRNAKFNRGHLLVRINHHTKWEVLWDMSYLSYWSDKLCLRTDGPTYGPTCTKQRTPNSSKGT